MFFVGREEYNNRFGLHTQSTKREQVITLPGSLLLSNYPSSIHISDHSLIGRLYQEPGMETRAHTNKSTHDRFQSPRVAYCGLPFHHASALNPGLLKEFSGRASPFQLSSVYYLFNPQFWEAAAKSEFNARGDLRTKSVVLLTMVIAFAAGPSTGIAMLPKLNWWAVTEHELETTYRPRALVNPILMHATLDDFFPKSLTSERFPSSCRLPFANQTDPLEVNSTINTVPVCMSEGAPQILQALTQALKSGREDDNQLQFNFSMSTTDHIRDISVGWEAGNISTGNGTVYGAIYATTLADLLTQEFQFQGDAMWQRLGIPVKATSQAARYSIKEQVITQSTNFFLDTITSTQETLSASNAQWRQPAVAIHCMGLEAGNGRVYVAKPSVSDPSPFGVLPNNLTFFLPENALESAPPPIQLLDIKDYLPVTNVSATFIAHSNTSLSKTLCLVAARWVPAEFLVSRPSEILAQSSLSAGSTIVEVMGPPTCQVPSIFQPTGRTASTLLLKSFTEGGRSPPTAPTWEHLNTLKLSATSKIAKPHAWPSRSRYTSQMPSHGFNMLGQSTTAMGTWTSHHTSQSNARS